MTLIIGARCLDGVVLIADTKALRDDDELDSQKLISLFNENVIFGVAGHENLLDKLLRQLGPDTDYMNTQRPENERSTPIFKGREDFLIYLERKMRVYNEEYSSNDAIGLDLLVAFAGEKASLHALGTDSPAESEIKGYIAIGHGAPYSKILLKPLWNLWQGNVKMVQVAPLLYFVYNTIVNFRLDITVGGKVVIYFIPDGEQARILNTEEIKQLELKNNALKKGFDDFLNSISDVVFSPDK